MAEWIDLGSLGWYYYPTTPLAGWINRRRDTHAWVYHRYGDPVQLRRLANKVVRGYLITAKQETPPRNNVTLAAWPYIVTPQPVLKWTVQDWTAGHSAERTAEFPDLGIPIGRFPNEPGNANPASDDWLGLYSADAVQNRQDTSPLDPNNPSDPNPPPVGARFYFTYYKLTPAPQRQFKVLVDDPPSWEIVAPEGVTRTDIVPLDVRLFWPDDSPVPGLRVRVTVGSFTSVRAAGGVFSFSSATATTDADGVARFEIRGDHVGAEALQIAFDNTDAWRADFFEPSFGTARSIFVNGLEGDDPETGCYVAPAQPPIEPRPGYISVEPTFQWDAGANSVTTLEGDARTVFTLEGGSVGTVVGFANDREDPTDPTRVTHGFFFSKSANAARRAQVYESGTMRGTAFAYTDTTSFEIRRVGTTVTYLIDGEQLYLSRVPSTGTLSVATSLFASGDVAPSNEGAP